MGKIKENKFLLVLILVGLIIFGFVASILLKANKKITVVVPNGTIEASTMVTTDMLKEVEISADTPGNFIRNPSSIVGSRLKNTVAENQLLYESDFMSSWTDYTQAEDVPDDYIITSIQVPDDRACGGIITAGDYVDILLVDEDKDKNKNTTNGEYVEETVPANVWLNNTNTNANFILANVLILTTDSALAASQESDMSTVQGTAASGGSDGSYYVIALSYNDYLKLRIADSAGGSIWMNICPAQNSEKNPLINQMASKKFAYLHDAQVQVMDEDGNMLVDDYYETDDNGLLIEKTNDQIDMSGMFTEDGETEETGEETTDEAVDEETETEETVE